MDVVEFERGVAVLAEKYWQAKRASQLVEVEWKGKERLKDLDTASLAEAAKNFSQGPGSHRIKNVGDVDEVFENQDHTHIELQYAYPYLSHATMEPQNCTVLMTENRAKYGCQLRHQRWLPWRFKHTLISPKTM